MSFPYAEDALLRMKVKFLQLVLFSRNYELLEWREKSKISVVSDSTTQDPKLAESPRNHEDYSFGSKILILI